MIEEEIQLPDIDARGPEKGVAGLPGRRPAILDAITKSELSPFSASFRKKEAPAQLQKSETKSSSNPIKMTTGHFRPGIDQLDTISGPMAEIARKALDSATSLESKCPAPPKTTDWELQIYHADEPLDWLASVPESATRIVVHEGLLPAGQNYGDRDRVESIAAGSGGPAGMVLRYGLARSQEASKEGHIVFLSGDQSTHGIAVSALDTLIQGEFAAPPDERLGPDVQTDGSKITLAEYYELLLGRKWPPSNHIKGRPLALPLCFSVSNARMAAHHESFYRRALLAISHPGMSRLFGCLICAIYGGADASVDDDHHPFLLLK
jgi:hypothetical protein